MGNVFISIKDIDVNNVIWIDARFNLQNAEEGRKLYGLEHIKGAVYWDLEKDLSDMTKDEGRHPMPEKEQLQSLFERSGLQYDTDKTIAVYDQGASPFATRAWWMLQYGGFKNAKIVKEGYTAIKEAGIAVQSGEEALTTTTLIPRWQDDLYVNRTGVKEIVDGKVKKVLLDARAEARYLGQIEPMDKVAGHIPGARNFDWEQLKADGVLTTNQKLHDVVKQDEQIVVYCGSGVTASPLFAILKEDGYSNVQLYTGSYSDWITEYAPEKGISKK
ncbi:sulfurtransferase [Viridibacillus arvi]|uniref:Thiosulfate sulfurtransferase n=1 Tax=Viridibacillus arvi TaxID=263475 RepID=A0A0M0LDI3_9BACL|nr:sulfurtransferase [Viridibacillus arvi]KOO49006.1 thiosulfate sulfurtransferase [Viridibacillus arvi]